MINSEIKKYDLEEMKMDTNHKMATNLNNLRKKQKVVITDENRNKR